MKEAYILREELTEIFERNYTRKGAKQAIRAWCKRARQSKISQFECFLGTIETGATQKSGIDRTQSM